MRRLAGLHHKWKFLLLCLTLTGLVASGWLVNGGLIVLAQTDSGYGLSWWTVDTGGRTGISGGDYTLLSTAGQPDARGAVVGGDYALYSGFWFGTLAYKGDVFLPIVMRGTGSQAQSDLVGRFVLVPDKSSYSAGEAVEIDATVTNTGSGSADAFWVDLYINPSVTPVVNVPWNNACSMTPCYGIAWYVAAGLGPGESVTLTSTSDSYSPAHSIWPGYFAAGTQDLYLLVDSWNPGVSSGGVLESNESNNLSERHGLTVSGASGAEMPSDWHDIPPRPAP